MNIELTPPVKVPALLQVGALPIRFRAGEAQVMLLTSRETRRWVIPKGWPMKGRSNWASAAQEAKQEGGLLGKTAKRPIGSFLYFKRRETYFDLCRVEVYALLVEKQLRTFREKGQREARWFSLEDAAEAVQETGLAALLRDFEAQPYRKPKRKKTKS